MTIEDGDYYVAHLYIINNLPAIHVLHEVNFPTQARELRRDKTEFLLHKKSYIISDEYDQWLKPDEISKKSKENIDSAAGRWSKLVIAAGFKVMHLPVEYVEETK